MVNMHTEYSPDTTGGTRDTYFDSIKGLLIFLVVIGHALETDLSTRMTSNIYDFIYLFHMPLFILISGYFTKTNDKEKFWKGILKLFKLFILFDILHYVATFSYPHSIEQLLTPGWSLWYLLSLIYFRIIVFFVDNQKKLNAHIFIICSMIVSISAGFIPFIGRPGDPLSLSRTFFFFPFFLMGYYSEKIKIFIVSQKLNKTFTIAIMTLVLICIVVINKPIRGILYGATHYFSRIESLYRLIIYILSSIMSVCVLSLVKSHKTLSNIGCKTLGIFLYHTFLLYPILYIHHKYITTINVFILLLIGITIFFIAYKFSKTKLSEKILSI